MVELAKVDTAAREWIERRLGTRKRELQVHLDRVAECRREIAHLETLRRARVAEVQT